MDWGHISSVLQSGFLFAVLLLLLRFAIMWYLGIASIQRELAETKQTLQQIRQEVAALRNRENSHGH